MSVFTFCQQGGAIQFYLGGVLVGQIRAGSPQMAALLRMVGDALSDPGGGDQPQ